MIRVKLTKSEEVLCQYKTYCGNLTSSSSSSNSDEAALLVLVWLEISGIDLLLGMAGNSCKKNHK